MQLCFSQKKLSLVIVCELEGSVTHAVRDTLQSIAVAGCDSSNQYM